MLKCGIAKRVNSNNPVCSCSTPSVRSSTCGMPKLSCASKVLCVFCSSVARTVARAFARRRRVMSTGTASVRATLVPKSHIAETQMLLSSCLRPPSASAYALLVACDYFGPHNGSVTQLRRGYRCHWRSGTALAATNEMSAGASCKRRDATALGDYRAGSAGGPTNGPPSVAVTS